MKQRLAALANDYAAALHEYLSNPGEPALKKGYELGRQAIADGIGILEMLGIHKNSVVAELSLLPTPDDCCVTIDRATAFFAESASSFEMALQGFQVANQVLDVERQRYEDQFEFAPDAYLVTDGDGMIREANRAAAQLFRCEKESLLQKSLLTFVVSTDQAAFSTSLAEIELGSNDRIDDLEIELESSDAVPFPAAFTLAVIRDNAGMLTGIRWLVRDISERRRVEQERANIAIREKVARAEAEAAERLTFLADASALLTASLDYDSTLGRVARHAVPYLGDWCFIHVLEDDGVVRCVAATNARADNGRETQDRLFRSALSSSDGSTGLRRALETGKSEAVLEVTDSWLSTIADGRDQLDVLRTLNLRSAVIVPMTARGRTLGTILLATVDLPRAYEPELTLLEDLARRCAFATDNAHLYRQVIIERDRAEKASRAKDEFIAVLSHELRNPLMPIMGWTRIFSNQSAIMNNEVLAEGVRSVERNAHNIQRLVEECMDLARVSERRIKLEKKVVGLNEIATASVGSIADVARSKGLRVNLQLSPDPLWLNADRSRLEQVVMNLLTNAIRYTPAGGSISIHSRRVGDEGEISVKDTGIGIAPDFLDQIFEPFRQGTAAWLTSDSGLGLGLAIARQIAISHVGRIWAQSDGLGFGSTFFLRLPLTTDPALETVSTMNPAAAHAADAPSLRVLLIEDSEDVLSLMRMELEWMGYTVLGAKDGTTGLELAEREHPDALISDIRMPGIDGYELIARIRKNPELRSIPAIALTGFGMKSDVQRALQEGYDAHLIKPADIVDLSALLQKLKAERQATKPS